MGTVTIIVGLSFIGLGLLIRKYPNLIAGYNTMSKKKKENVDIEGLSTFARKAFVIIGVSVIVTYYFFSLLGTRFSLPGLRIIGESLVVIIPFMGLVVLVTGSRKFNRNERKYPYASTILAVVIILSVLTMLGYGYSPAKIVMDNDKMKITGMYGFELSGGEIADVEIAGTIPAVKARTNGMSFAGVDKGYYSIDLWGKCRLFSDSRNNGPYLIVTDNDGLRTIFKTKSLSEAEEYHDSINKIRAE